MDRDFRRARALIPESPQETAAIAAAEAARVLSRLCGTPVGGFRIVLERLSLRAHGEIGGGWRPHSFEGVLADSGSSGLPRGSAIAYGELQSRLGREIDGCVRDLDAGGSLALLAEGSRLDAGAGWACAWTSPWPDGPNELLHPKSHEDPEKIQEHLRRLSVVLAQGAFGGECGGILADGPVLLDDGAGVVVRPGLRKAPRSAHERLEEGAALEAAVPGRGKALADAAAAAFAKNAGPLILGRSGDAAVLLDGSFLGGRGAPLAAADTAGRRRTCRGDAP